MSHSVDECYAVYSETTYRARKEHACDACERIVAPGQYYCRVFYIWEGKKTHLKRCGACQRTHEHLRELGQSHGDFWPSETLSCGLGYRDEWNEDPPAEIQALAFATNEETGDLLGPLARLKDWAAQREHYVLHHDWHRPPQVAFRRLVNVGEL